MDDRLPPPAWVAWAITFLILASMVGAIYAGVLAARALG